MDANEVRGTLNTVLYGVIFTRELTDAEAERLEFLSRVATRLGGGPQRSSPQ